MLIATLLAPKNLAEIVEIDFPNPKNYSDPFVREFRPTVPPRSERISN